MTKEEFYTLEVGDLIKIIQHDFHDLSFDNIDDVDIDYDKEYDIINIDKEKECIIINYYDHTSDICTKTTVYYLDAFNLSTRLILNEEILNSIKNTLLRVYPDTHDINLKNDRIIIQIHFPKNTITNNNGVSNEILDLFIKLVFYPCGTLDIIEGTRTTCTDIEVQRGYCHSHISASIGTYSSNVCFGTDTSIVEARQELYINYNEDMFECFLYMLQDFVVHESIKGGPYGGGLQKLYNGINLSTFIESRILKQSYNQYLQKTSVFNLTILQHNDFNEFDIVKDEEFEKSVYEILKNNFSQQIVIKENNKYINKTSISLSDSDYKSLCERHKNSHVIFKDKIIPIVILRTKEKEITNADFCMNPEITKYILSNLKQDINKFYNEQYNKVV